MGHVSTPSVSSVSVTCHDFWLKLDNGKEQNLQLRDVDIPLRTGQRVTVVYGCKKEKNSGPALMLVNHNAEKHWFLSSNLLNKLGMDRQGIYWLAVFPAYLSFPLSLGTTDMKVVGISIFFFLLGVVSVILLIVRTVMNIKDNKNLRAHLDDIAQQLLKNG